MSAHRCDLLRLVRYAVGLVVVCLPPLTAAGDEIRFDTQIRPLLSDKCFACHGPDDNHREGGFRLDQKESAFSEADSGMRVIVPGKPDESELLARITAEDPGLRMPPPDSNKSLTAAEMDLIRRWIEQGAAWREHWSLTPPERPELPQVSDGQWPRNAIDRFIQARLEREGLQPESPADKVTLIRRVTFDLTGLPPTPAEVDAFLADESPEAYERLVDRLLRSPHYGEHMARYWLDAARYGDTHGLHLDNYREMWPYRDWVVQAFNDNMPYDRFTIEQLAGDLLPDPTLDQIVATGFNRAHITTNEGGSIQEEVYVRNVVDRVVTFGTVFMGMTLECTRCHDHKFDPFTMNDFYSLFAYFNSLDGSPLDGNRKDPAPVVRVPSKQQQERQAELDRLIAEADRKLREAWPEVDRHQAEWEQQLLTNLGVAAADAESAPPAAEGQAAKAVDGQAAKAVDDQAAKAVDGQAAKDGANAEQQEQKKGDEKPNSDANPKGALVLGDWYTVGPFNDNRRYLASRQHGPEGKPVNLDESFKLSTGEMARWTRRPEWSDGKVHQGLPGDLAANFLYRKITADTSRKIDVSLGSDDAIKVYLNGKQLLANDVARGVAPDQEKLELPLQAGDNHLLIKIMNYGGASGFYFQVTSELAAVPPEVLAAVRKPAEERTEAESRTVRDYYRNKVAALPELDAARDQVKKLREQRAEVDRQIPITLVFKETKDPRPAYNLKRGEYDQRGDEVSRRTPRSLPPMPDDLPNNRLGLARWLVSPEHPLTARVAVNRFWQQLFGTGIVKTAEDFGSQGEPPSHPELLDWLAVEFQENGWNVKHLLKQMAMSATYRQSSRVTPEKYQRDPANRLLARGPRFRLDAEMLRDQALAVSGLLVEDLGGPSVKPPQPDGLWFAVGYSGSNTVRFVPDKDHAAIHRRTLYTFIKRTAPPPQMSILDAPSRESCVVRRERTNTPLQALMLYNDPQYVETARGLAERAMREGGETPEQRATHMFRLCTARRPSDQELKELVAGYQEELAHYQQDGEAAQALASAGHIPRDESLPAAEVAAWTMLANMILNLDEVVTRN